MNICVTVNSKYMRYLYVMLQSLYENNQKKSINLYVIQRDFTDYDKDQITYITKQFDNEVHFIWVDEHKFDDFPIYKSGRTNLSLEIYFRLLIPEYLPDSLDRVLMLDVDIVVNKNIEDLYNIDFEDRVLAAAPNMCHNLEIRKDWRRWYSKSRKNWVHYNTGILLWNLEKIRKEYPKEFIFNKAYSEKIETATFEEELFNVLFGEDNIKPLDPQKWNYISTHAKSFENPKFYVYSDLEEIKRECGIVHYAALNPWQEGVKNDSFKMWWIYAMRTPFGEQILSECYWKCEEMVDKQAKILIYIDLLHEDYHISHIVQKLKEKNCSRIMIYGACRISKFLFRALCDTDIKTVCFIDKRYRGDYCGIPTIGLDEIHHYSFDADAIVITQTYFFDEIVKDIGNINTCQCVSLDDLLK